MAQKEEDVLVPRYLLFVGCADKDCGMEQHEHHIGFETLAASTDDLENFTREVLALPDHLWWHVVDLNDMRIIMRNGEPEDKANIH